MSTIMLRRDGQCADCGAALPAGVKARWYRSGAVYGLDCHEKQGATALTVQPTTTALAVRPVRGTVVPPLLIALQRAEEAADAAKASFAAQYYTHPAFAVVENAPGDGVFYNPKAPTKVVGSMFDVCGFVWLEVSFKDGAALIAAFRRHGTLRTDRPNRDKEWKLGAFSLSYSKSHSRWSTGWSLHAPSVFYGNGSMSAEEAAGSAFASSLHNASFPGVRRMSRID